MRKLFETIKQKNVWMLLLVLAMSLFGVGDIMTANTAAVEGVAGVGKHISGDALNTEVIREQSPDLLLSDIDDRITKISPYKNPIDQIARTVGRQMKAHGMEYKHYSVDTAPITDTVSANYTENGASAHGFLPVTNPDLFNEQDTIIVNGVKGYIADGTATTEKDLMLYVCGKDSSSPQKLQVVAINGKKVGSKITVPSIGANTQLVKLGPAAIEGDIRTVAQSVLPTPETKFLQIFKAEVSETTIAQMSLKEVKWELDDQIQYAITNLRAQIESTSLKGIQGKTVVPNKKLPVYTTGGIYWDIDKEFMLPAEPANKDLVKMHRYIFGGQSGSDKKVLLMGSEFNEAISTIPYIQKQLESGKTEVHWGLTWNMITTNFGVTAARQYDLLDQMGMSDQAIVLDPEYLDKWTLIPFGSKDIDTKTNGVFDGDVNVTTEVSGVCLRYKDAHCRLKLYSPVKVTGITTSAATVTRAAGATYDFGATCTIAPATASVKDVTYVSSEPTKVSVNASGVATALASGTAVISAITADGNYTAICTVTVS